MLSHATPSTTPSETTQNPHPDGLARQKIARLAAEKQLRLDWPATMILWELADRDGPNLNNGRGWQHSAKQWATQLGVSVRAVERSIRALKVAGLIVVTSRGTNGGHGHGNSYRLTYDRATESESSNLHLPTHQAESLPTHQSVSSSLLTDSPVGLNKEEIKKGKKESNVSLPLPYRARRRTLANDDLVSPPPVAIAPEEVAELSDLDPDQPAENDFPLTLPPPPPEPARENDRDVDYRQVYKFAQNHKLAIPSGQVMKDANRVHGYECILHCLEESVLHNKVSWQYAETIMYAHRRKETCRGHGLTRSEKLTAGLPL